MGEIRPIKQLVTEYESRLKRQNAHFIKPYVIKFNINKPRKNNQGTQQMKIDGVIAEINNHYNEQKV